MISLFSEFAWDSFVLRVDDRSGISSQREGRGCGEAKGPFR